MSNNGGWWQPPTPPGPPGGPLGGPPPYGPPPPGGQWGPTGPFGSTPWGRIQLAPKPGVIPLRPLNAGEIVNAIFTTIRYNFLAVYGPPLITGLGCLAIFGIFGAIEWSPLHDFWVNARAHVDDPGWHPSDSEITNAAVAFGGIVLLFAVCSFAVYLAASLSSVATLRHAVVGRRVGFRQAASESLPSFWRLLGALLLVQLLCVVPITVVIGLVVLLAFVSSSAAISVLLGIVCYFTAIAAMIYIQIRLVPLSATVILEGKGPIEAIRRAWRLNEGGWWRSLGITLLVGLIGSVAQFLVNQVLSVFLAGSVGLTGTPTTDPNSPTFVRDQLIAMMALYAVMLPVGLLLSLATLPLIPMAHGLLYIDRRIRRESLDLQLAEEAGIPFAGTAPPPPTGPADPADPVDSPGE
ncbi:hypothetical protein [Streptacidiphilus neutrinimicus]|uniref:hypothetical protein n=1 Tax=Streptacidiphilus neutrinimicus TaxID=105420 RepID=UPI000AE9A055|nr:hypothetical protein [Streptacidiphilus neutrinimicus]